MNLNIKDIVKGNVCRFSFLRAGFACYEITINTEDSEYDFTTYQFYIPLDDLSGATLKHTEKAISLMRWIRKAIENNEFVLVGYTKLQNT